MNVRNDGAVNSGANAASSVISDADGQHGIGEHRSRSPFPGKGGQGRGRATPAIMESMPQTPGEQARNDVTARITARVAAGWPRLGQPEVRFRGRYCYVAVTLPGHRGPTPFLRLRWTGLTRRMGHRHLQGHHRDIQRKRVPLVLRPAHRHPRAGNRRDPRPLRRPASREVITPTRRPQNCESRRTQELQEICAVLPGRNRVARDEDADSDFRVIRAEDIRFNLAPWSELPRSNRRKASSVEVSPGDIIGSVSGPYGRWAVVPEGYGPPSPAITPSCLPRGDVSKWYLLGFLRSTQGKELLESTQRGSVIFRLSAPQLRQIPIPLCPLPPDYVDSVLRELKAENNRLERGIKNFMAAPTLCMRVPAP